MTGARGGDPVEQAGSIRGHAGRWRKGARVLGRETIDHRQPGVDRGAVAGIGLAGERRGEDDAAFSCNRTKLSRQAG